MAVKLTLHHVVRGSDLVVPAMNAEDSLSAIYLLYLTSKVKHCSGINWASIEYLL